MPPFAQRDYLSAMKFVSVNEAIGNANLLFEKEVFLHGVLDFSDDKVLIVHWPKSGRVLQGFDQIWVHTGTGAFAANKEVLSRINAKRVVLRGKLQPNRVLWPDDPGSCWAVHMLATELTEYKMWSKEHGDE